jgi:GT2 family glycosyltransferase
VSDLTVFLGVPTRGLVDVQIAEGIARLAADLDTTPFYERGHVSAGMTRNLIVNKFLASGADVLVMVDDDVYPAANAATIIDRLEEGFDIVGAAYPIFKPELGWPIPVPAAFRVDGGDYEILPATGGIVECDAIGTGCVAIRRDVLEAMEVPFAETMTDDGAGIVSDDFVFCRCARDAGWRIGVDFDVRCDHLVRVSLGAVLAGFAQHSSRIVIPNGVPVA